MIGLTFWFCADTYHKCLQQNLDSYENCVEKVSVYARNLHESLTVEAVTIECKLVSVLESLSEFEAATSLSAGTIPQKTRLFASSTISRTKK
jgi:hypothetical protein